MFQVWRFLGRCTADSQSHQLRISRMFCISVLSRQHGDKWEKEKMFPAHEVMKKFGNAGLLGINKPVEYGGVGLDYKYQERGSWTELKIGSLWEWVFKKYWEAKYNLDILHAQLAFLEAMGYLRYGGVGMGIGVHTDCSTPALARDGTSLLSKYTAPPAVGHIILIFETSWFWSKEYLMQYPRKGNLDNFRYFLYDILQICNHKKVKCVNKWPLHLSLWCI